MSEFLLKPEDFSTWAQPLSAGPIIWEAWTNAERATFFLSSFPCVFVISLRLSRHAATERRLVFITASSFSLYGKQQTCWELPNMPQLDLSSGTQEAFPQKEIESKERLHLSSLSVLFPSCRGVAFRFLQCTSTLSLRVAVKIVCMRDFSEVIEN